MRDPKRLDNFYDILKELHKKFVPYWRFGQLFNNLQRQEGNDLFYYEEDELIEAVEKLVKDCYNM